jgi:hypothetical protein
LAGWKTNYEVLRCYVSFAKLKSVDWDFVDAKVLKKLVAWVCDSATSGERLTLLQSCLSGIPLYYMSMFLMNKTFVEKLVKRMRRIFWQSKIKKRKYYMVKWKKSVDLKLRVVWMLRT